jgi:hypothetical protein
MPNTQDTSEKVIPILGCPDIRTQVSFYQTLGFEVVEIFLKLKQQAGKDIFVGSASLIATLTQPDLSPPGSCGQPEEREEQDRRFNRPSIVIAVAATLCILVYRKRNLP